MRSENKNTEQVTSCCAVFLLCWEELNTCVYELYSVHYIKLVILQTNQMFFHLHLALILPNIKVNGKIPTNNL